MNEANTSKHSPQQIVIDGSEGEGGGQIVRNAISYATILQIPIKVHSIRAKRDKPGLKAQHKTGLKLAVDICGGSLVGADIGSDCIEYDPSTDRNKNNEKEDIKEIDNEVEKVSSLIQANTGTAGSICLLLQVGLPCALFARNEPSLSAVSMCLEGGTNATLAPQIDYFNEVFLPVMSHHCLNVESYTESIGIDIERRGYYPIGGGVVKCSIPKYIQNSGQPLNPIILIERGKLKSIHIKSYHGGKVPRTVASQIANAAHRYITQSSSAIPELTGIIPSLEIIKHSNAKGSGTGIVIIGKTTTNCIFGASAIGNRKVKPQQTGEGAAIELLDSLLSGGCVDDWLSDQLILFMALAKGESKVLTGGLTLHTRSAIEVASVLTKARFDVKRIIIEQETDSTFTTVYSPSSSSYCSHGRVNGRHMITCMGSGYCGTKTNL